jgi:hypothetical protein
VRARLLIVAALVGATTTSGAAELTLGPRALVEAIDIGQSRLESVRTRFHGAYRIRVDVAPIDEIEIVTPFRRVVLAAETRARTGDRTFGQREALAVLGLSPRQVDLLIELTFHPLNTFIGVPAYDVRLLAAGAASKPTVLPLGVERFPRFGPRLESGSRSYPYVLGGPGVAGGQPLTGGTLLVRLEDDALANGRYDVLVVESGKDVGRARVDFGALR